MKLNLDRVFLIIFTLCVITSASNWNKTMEDQFMDVNNSSFEIEDNHLWIANETIYPTDSMQGTTNFPENVDNVTSTATTTTDHVWELHLYTIAVLFLVTALVSVICFCRACINCGPKCYHFVLVHFLIFCVSITRVCSLLLNSIFPVLVQVFIFNLSFPCLLSSFTLLFHVLLHLVPIQRVPQKLQQPSSLGIIIIIQFATILLAGVGIQMLKIHNSSVISQSVFVLWTVVTSGMYLSVFRHLYSTARRKQCELIRFTFTKLHIEGNRLPNKLPNLPLSWVIKVMATVSVLLLFLSCLFIIDFLIHTGLFKQLEIYLWCFQLACRIIELILCVLMTYVAIQPLHEDFPAKCVFSFICSKDLWGCSCSDNRASTADDIYPACCASNSAVARTHFTFENWASSNTFNNQHMVVPPTLRKHFSQQFTSGTSRSETIATSTNKRHVTMTALATLSDVHSHPPSMLFNENGFIRFREESDSSDTRHIYSSPIRHPYGTVTLRRFGSSESNGFDVHLQRPPSITKTEELYRRRSGGSTPSKDAIPCGRPIPNLNLPCIPATSNKLPQDITPDSAVYMDLPNDDIVDEMILCPDFEVPVSYSHSMTDLPAILTPKHKGRTRSLLTRLRGSSFSLASQKGYEQLESKMECQCNAYSDVNRQWEMRTAFRDNGGASSRASSRLSRARRDSFYDSSNGSSKNGSCNVVTFVDIEVQTDPMDFGNQVVCQNESKM